MGALAALVAWWEAHVAPRAGSAAPGLDKMAHGGWRVSYRLAHWAQGTLRGVLPGDHPLPPPRDDVVPPPPGDGSGFLRVAVIVLPLLLILAVALAAWGLGDDAASGSGAPPADGAPATGDFGGMVARARELLLQANNVDEATAQTLAQQATELLAQAAPWRRMPTRRQRFKRCSSRLPNWWRGRALPCAHPPRPWL